MAEPKQLPSGSWRIQIKVGQIKDGATFSTKAEARAWAEARKTELREDQSGKVPNKTFGDLLEKYKDIVSPTKAGRRWEEIRISLFQRDSMASVNLRDLDSTHAASWRDRRLREVSAGTVLREWNLLSNACKVAIQEWKWLKANPFTGLRRPPTPPPRDRLISCEEADSILAALGWSDGVEPSTISVRVAYAFLWAMETAMRAGEICRLMPEDVGEHAVRVGRGKTRAAKRETPLMPYAREIADVLKQHPPKDGSLFGLKESQIDALFRKARDKCGIDGLHFHDSRANGITMLVTHARMDITDLARAIGHTNLKQLMVYYRRKPADVGEAFARRFG